MSTPRTTTSPAPVITTTRDGGRYPQDGDLIGSAWEIAWEILDQRAPWWVNSTELASIVTYDVGATDKTVRNLLGQARRRGILEVAYRPHGLPARRTASYRPTDTFGADRDRPGVRRHPTSTRAPPGRPRRRPRGGPRHLLLPPARAHLDLRLRRGRARQLLTALP